MDWLELAKHSSIYIRKIKSGWIITDTDYLEKVKELPPQLSFVSRLAKKSISLDYRDGIPYINNLESIEWNDIMGMMKGLEKYTIPCARVNSFIRIQIWEMQILFYNDKYRIGLLVPEVYGVGKVWVPNWVPKSNEEPILYEGLARTELGVVRTEAVSKYSNRMAKKMVPLIKIVKEMENL